MPLPEGFIFSQGKFQDYIDCQRRFQLRYLIEQPWPALEISPVTKFERLTILGQKFHQMVHQFNLGISRERIREMIKEDELKVWWTNFINHQREDSELGFIWHQYNQIQTEVLVTATINNYNLIAKYDLISFIKDNRVIILDWKTSNKHPGRDFLKKRMQTRMYPFILVEQGTHLSSRRKINPDDVEMIYWFTNFPESAVKFKYSQEKHKSIKQELTTIINEINHKKRDNFMLTSNKTLCRFCIYRSLCERGIEAGDLEEVLIQPESQNDIFELGIEIEQIAEIEF